MVERHRVERGVDPAAGEQGGQGRGEAQGAGLLGDVEGLDAEAVAGEHEPPAVALGDGEREHADEPVDEPLAPRVVGLEDDLGVGGGEEAVARRGELLAELAVVVDAAVEDDREAEVGVHHGLAPRGGQVDDAQAAVAERRGSLGPQAARVGPPVAHGRGHAVDGRDVGRPIPAQLARDPAHGREARRSAGPALGRCPEPAVACAEDAPAPDERPSPGGGPAPGFRPEAAPARRITGPPTARPAAATFGGFPEPPASRMM